MTKTASVADALAHAHSLLAEHPGRAAQQAGAILLAVPGHPEAILISGAAARRQGRLAEAASLLGKLAQEQPRAAAAQFEWAATQAELGEAGAAVATLRRAVALRPEMTAAWRLLGDLLMLQGERAQAEAAYARHIRSAIHDPALMEAADALCTGDVPRAEHLLRRHLMAAPTDVAAMRMLAEIGTRLGEYGDAENLLARCLELAPDFTPARHNYAVVLFRQGKSEQALPHIRRLLEEDASDPSYRNLLAATLATLGEFERSAATYEKVLREFPDQPKIWLSYGHALKTAGRTDEAIAAYRGAIARAPGFGEAHWSLANLKTYRFERDEVALMEQQLGRPGTGGEDRFHLHYALGRAFEQAERYPQSFEHYAEGARLRRERITYSAARTTRQLERARTLFGADFFAEREGQGCPDPAPIFIVGLPRSGSTLLEQILASHSQVEGTMELPELANMSRELGRTSAAGPDIYPESLAELAPGKRAALGRRFIESTRVQRKLGKPYFIDKMPGNFTHIGLIRLILPNAKIIDARRHPMGACFSAFKQHFARGHHFSYDLAELGQYYRDYVALMEHFDLVLPRLVHRVLYEDMVRDTEREIRRLLDYLGLDFEPACLRFHENERAVRTASSEQVRQPIYREGLDHWRHYAPWLSPLEEALGPQGFEIGASGT